MTLPAPQQKCRTRADFSSSPSRKRSDPPALSCRSATSYGVEWHGNRLAASPDMKSTGVRSLIVLLLSVLPALAAGSAELQRAEDQYQRTDYEAVLKTLLTYSPKTAAVDALIGKSAPALLAPTFTIACMRSFSEFPSWGMINRAFSDETNKMRQLHAATRQVSNAVRDPQPDVGFCRNSNPSAE